MKPAFTPKEITAELNLRAAAERKRDAGFAEQERRARMALADADCIHCGQPFQTYLSTGGPFGICQDCIDG